MKKIVLVGVVVVVFIFFNVMVDVIVFVIVSWDVSVMKDIISVLVVILLKFLNFQYVEGIKVFNFQKGVFDIIIQGQFGVIDFMLIFQIVSNILSCIIDVFILVVGVNWNGNVLNKFILVMMIDIFNNIFVGLDVLVVVIVFVGVDCVSIQGNFDFIIDFVIFDGSIVVEFKDLIDGYWSGDVCVQFNVVWII